MKMKIQHARKLWKTMKAMLIGKHIALSAA